MKTDWREELGRAMLDGDPERTKPMPARIPPERMVRAIPCFSAIADPLVAQRFVASPL